MPELRRKTHLHGESFAIVREFYMRWSLAAQKTGALARRATARCIVPPMALSTGCRSPCPKAATPRMAWQLIPTMQTGFTWQRGRALQVSTEMAAESFFQRMQARPGGKFWIATGTFTT